MPRIARSEILQRLREKIARGQPIVGGGAGTGLSAKCEEAGGIDLIVIYNSGRYRMAGRGSLAGLLAYGNANEIVVEMAREVLPVVQPHAGAGRRQRHRPVHRSRRSSSGALAELGFSGVQNFPTVGLIDGMFRANLEETGMGYGLEVDMIARRAQARPADHALRLQRATTRVAMARAGADIIVCHMGLTTGGTIGAETALTLEGCVPLIDDWARAALDAIRRT